MKNIIKNIPKWIGIIILLACGVFLLYYRFGSILRSTKVVSSCMLMLIIFLHLAIADPLHVIYDQSEIGSKIKKAQCQGGAVAIFPAELSSQFQFAGRLTKRLIPKKNNRKYGAMGTSEPASILSYFYCKRVL